MSFSVKAEAESEMLDGSEEEEETSGNLQVKSLEEIQREKALNSLRSNLSKQIEELNEDVEEAEEEEIEEKEEIQIPKWSRAEMYAKKCNIHLKLLLALIFGDITKLCRQRRDPNDFTTFQLTLLTEKTRL